MDDDIKIPPQLKPAVDKFYDDLSAVLTDYESAISSEEDLYAFMVNLHRQLNLIIYND